MFDFWTVIRVLLTALFSVCNILMFTDWRFSKKVTLIIAALCVTVISTVVCSVYALAGNVWTLIPILSMLLQVASVFGMCSLFSKKFNGNVIFAFASVAVINMIGGVISTSLTLVISNNFGYYALIVLIYAAIELLIYRFLRKPVLKLLANSKKHWWLLFVIPLTITILMFAFIHYPVSLLNNTSFIPASLALCALTVIVFGIMAAMFNILYKQYDSAIRNKTLEYEVSLLENKINDLDSNENKIAILRHDLKHYSQILSDLMKNGRLSEADKVLSDLNEKISKVTLIKSEIFCDNVYLNSVVSHFNDKCKENYIAFYAQINLPDKVENASEISVMLANCLDNAFNASVKTDKPEMSLLIAPAGDQLFIEISNNYEGDLTINKLTGLPVTLDRGHGFGAKSIQSTIKSRNGTFTVTNIDNVFSLKIIL